MIAFLIKSSVVLLILWAFYRLVLEKETFFAQNRMYLLVSLALACTLPFITLPQLIADQGIVSTTIEKLPLEEKVETKIATETTVASQMNESISTNEQISNSKTDLKKTVETDLIATTENTTADISQKENTTPIIKQAEQETAIISPAKKAETVRGWSFWLTTIYLFGVVIFAFHLLTQVLSIALKIWKSDDKIEDEKAVIINSALVKEPCSFFKYIFINPADYDYDTYEQILEHEKIHVQQSHSFDLLLSEIAVVLFWFNPLVWIFRKDVERNIEFQTDSLLLHGEAEVKESYQMNLVKIATYSRPLTVTTNYNQSLIKQRILKMNTKKSNPHSNWKFAFVLPLVFGVLLFLNKPTLLAANNSNDNFSTNDAIENIATMSEAENLAEINTINPIAPEPNDKSKSSTSNLSDCEQLLRAAKQDDVEKVRTLLANFDATCMPYAQKQDFENMKYIKFMVENEGEILIDNYREKIVIEGVSIALTNHDYDVREGFGNAIKADCKEFYKAIRLRDAERVKDLLMNLEKECIENPTDAQRLADLKLTKEILKSGAEIQFLEQKVMISMDELVVNNNRNSSQSQGLTKTKNQASASDCKKLINAIYDNDLAQVKKLVETTDVNCTDSEPGFIEKKGNGNSWYRQTKARTPLVAAARLGNLEIGNVLLQAGAKPTFHDQNNETPLNAAAGSGNLEFVKVMLEKGNRLNKNSDSFGTPLNAAAGNGHTAVVKFLITKGAKINASSDGQGTALNAAARNGHMETVELLLKNKANINEARDGQGSALNAAARNGHTEVVNLLLKNGAKIDNATDGQGSALNAAARNGLTATVQLLLDQGADVNEATDGQGSALNAAARNGHNDMIALLLKNGANINDATDGQGSALNAAARNGLTETVKLLLNNGAKINDWTNGQGSALHAAARNGNVEVVKLLLNNGAKADLYVDGQGTPLSTAQKNKQTKVIGILKKRIATEYQKSTSGAQSMEERKSIISSDFKQNMPSEKQENNCEALLAAVKNQDAALVQELLKTVDANCVYRNNKNVRTPLVQAARNGNLEVGKMLVAANAKIDFHARGDESPLMAASANGHLDFVEYLMDKGAEVNKKVKGDGTALLVAARNGHLETVQYLLSKNANVNAAVRGDGTALINAVRSDQYEVAKVLLENGADANQVVRGDEYAMYHARMAGNTKMIKLLKQYEDR